MNFRAAYKLCKWMWCFYAVSTKRQFLYLCSYLYICAGYNNCYVGNDTLVLEPLSGTCNKILELTVHFIESHSNIVIRLNIEKTSKIGIVLL